MTGHLVWDVKMEFTSKSRWVLDVHKTPSPIGLTYAGVVSRESVRIDFTYAALNGLDVCAADIQNAYLQANDHKITTSYVVLNLVLKISDELRSFIKHYMAASRQASILETIFDLACDT